MRVRAPSRSILLAAALWLGAGQASAQSGLSSEQIDQISRTVVRVVGLEGGEEVVSGSGTVVGAGELIYTNRHVVEGAEDFSIEVLEDPNERPVPRYRARLVGYSMDVDFAVLQIDRDDRGAQISAGQIDLPALSLSSQSGESRRGDGVFVFGYPGIGDGYLVFTEGTVTTVRNGTINDARLPVWYQTDAEFGPGNSGGLAVNSRGEMVGIPTLIRGESVTGGRLGGILPLNAVRGALESGLETDVSRLATATSIPVIEGGMLDFYASPTYGSEELTAFFTPDPFIIELVSGGTVDASYLGGECVGHAAEAPDLRLSWSGVSSQLRILFNAASGEDASLLVNLPDGTWLCNDDTDGLDPQVFLSDPPEGQYDIWVGSYEPGEMFSGTLSISELDAEAQTPEIDLLRVGAEAGDAVAQNNLGIAYGTGRSVEQDYAEAFKWYQLAAEQGLAEAQFNVGLFYAEGLGVEQDDAVAVRWYRLAADQGYAAAQYNLGVAYINGRGVPQDDAVAVRWYRLAADQGYAAAQHNLGYAYEFGLGVEQDDVEAARWYRLAADQGNADAHYNLGLMYETGKGVVQDHVQAYIWFSLSASRSSGEERDNAARNRDRIANLLTPDQIAEAQRLTREWDEAHPLRETDEFR